MRFILYIFLLFLLAFYNTILGEIISISGVSIDLAGLLVALVALYRGESTAIWFAIGAAIVTSTPRLDLMPYEMATLIGMSIIINMICNRMNFYSQASRLIMLIIFLLVHNMVITVVISSDGMFFALYRFILPGILYSIIFGWLYFVVHDGLFGFRRAGSVS
ncbi:membrane hypothetical protein [Candidatus Zixiibacteriota bacterium]|nr:membrane hypothetical protein [candidate division Zixibacteria bacterium]